MRPAPDGVGFLGAPDDLAQPEEAGKSSRIAAAGRVPVVSLSPTGITRALRTLPCPHCRAAIGRTLAFCPHCGLKTGFQQHRESACAACGQKLPVADDIAFCPACSAPVRGGLDHPHLHDSTQPRRRFSGLPRAGAKPRLALLDSEGDVEREIQLDRDVIVVGRDRGDLVFDDDTISPEHALISWKEDEIRVRDLGSASGSWVFVLQPQELTDGDVLLIGSQVIRFRKLVHHDVKATLADRRNSVVGLPSRDDAMLEQLRADGTVRDVIYLSPGRTVLIGREQGDWVFPYDPTMSARHAEVRSLADRGVYVVRDLGSRNGLAILVRGERTLLPGERLLLGRRMLRVELS